MDSIQIQPCANGYMVRKAPDWANDRCAQASETHVFESFNSLVAHLREAMPDPAAPKKR